MLFWKRRPLCSELNDPVRLNVPVLVIGPAERGRAQITGAQVQPLLPGQRAAQAELQQTRRAARRLGDALRAVAATIFSTNG